VSGVYLGFGICLGSSSEDKEVEHLKYSRIFEMEQRTKLWDSVLSSLFRKKIEAMRCYSTEYFVREYLYLPMRELRVEGIDLSHRLMAKG